MVGRFQSERTSEFTESVIRSMTRLAVRHGAVNLAQGFPDFPAPEALKEAARQAISADVNQYAITWGAKVLRDAIAAKYQRTYQLSVDPETEITVCCGATEGMIASLLGVANPGDEIVVFEPFYENYDPDIKLAGATRRLVTLRVPDWSFDPDELRAAFSARTKAIIVNTPHNPTGKVFTRQELEHIAALCQEFDCLAITDEIYEHITYDGAQHIPIVSLPGMRGRSILINSMSKTFSVTGWRVGWVIAAPELTASVRKVHDFLTVGAASPLQHASAIALRLENDFLKRLASGYLERRDLLLGILEKCGFACFHPRGAYYIMAGISAFGLGDDIAFCNYLVEQLHVAAVPGCSFYGGLNREKRHIRFCFCKKYETLNEAGRRLSLIVRR